MEPEAQQYLDIAKEGLQAANRTGLLKKLVSYIRPSNIGGTHQPTDYRDEALRALQENAVETLAGLTLTVAEAAQILEPEFELDDLDNVNPTWQRHWTSGTSKVGIDDAERRTWWARLLAGEIQQPETFSLRTLAAMDTLSTKEAKLFTRVCAYVWNPRAPLIILPSDESTLWKPDFSVGTLLESAGLFKFNAVGDLTWGTSDRTPAERMARPPTIEMTFNDSVYVVSSTANKPIRLRCGQLSLTDIGQEVYRLTMANYSPTYRDEIVEEWRKTYRIEFVMQP